MWCSLPLSSLPPTFRRRLDVVWRIISHVIHSKGDAGTSTTDDSMRAAIWQVAWHPHRSTTNANLPIADRIPTITYTSTHESHSTTCPIPNLQLGYICADLHLPRNLAVRCLKCFRANIADMKPVFSAGLWPLGNFGLVNVFAIASHSRPQANPPHQTHGGCFFRNINGTAQPSMTPVVPRNPRSQRYGRLPPVKTEGPN